MSSFIQAKTGRFLVYTTLLLLLTAMGCSKGGGGGDAGPTLTVIPQSTPVFDFLCMAGYTAEQAGDIILEVDGGSLTNLQLYYRVGAAGTWVLAANVVQVTPGSGQYQLTWSSDLEALFTDARVEDIYVQVRSDEADTQEFGPFIIDNTMIPEITAMTPEQDSGIIPVTVTTQANGRSYALELQVDPDGPDGPEGFRCADTENGNPITGTDADVTFLWNSAVHVPASHSAPVTVTFRAVALTTRFDPNISVLPMDHEIFNPMPDIDVTPATLDFGDVVLNTASPAQAVTITNTGTADLTLSAITLTGSGDFSITSAPAPTTVIPAGSFETVQVAYLPTALGAAAGTLEIVSDDSDESVVQVPLSGNGIPVPAPDIAATPAALDFGEVHAESSLQRSVTITNNGNADLTLSAIALDAASSPDFSLAPVGTPVVLTAAQSLTVSVTYAPTAVGTDAGELIIDSDDPDTPTISIPLSGTGLPAPAPDIAVTPAALDFGEVIAGGSLQQSVTITNNGNADLTLLSIALDGAGSADFSLTPVGTPTVLPPAQSLDVSLTYAPTDEGTDAGELTINSDDLDTPAITIALSGNGLPPPPPDIAVTPAALDFGEVHAGSDLQQSVTITNNGATNLILSAIALDAAGSADFSLTPVGTPAVLSAAQSLNVSVTYAPTDEGTDAGELIIDSNDPDTPTISIPLSGTGLPAPAPDIAVTPAALDFGEVNAGSSLQQSVTITNNGNADLTLSAIALAPASSADFSLAPVGTPAVVPAAQSLTVSVTYAPSAVGADAGELTIDSDDPDTPSITIALSGTGLPAPAPDIAATPAALDFGELETGSSLQQSVTITNNGNADLTLSAIALAPASSADFTLTPVGTPAVVPAAQSLTVSVTYAPTDEGADTGELTIDSNDPDTPSITIALSGNGVAPSLPVIDVSPMSIDFDDVIMGTDAQTQVTIANTGTDDLEVLQLTINGSADFSLSAPPATPFIIPAGASEPVTVQYAPGDLGEDNGALDIASNDGDNAVVSVTLLGNGIAEPPPAPPPVTLAEGKLSAFDVFDIQAGQAIKQGEYYSVALDDSPFRLSGYPAPFDTEPSAVFILETDGDSMNCLGTEEGFVDPRNSVTMPLTADQGTVVDPQSAMFILNSGMTEPITTERVLIGGAVATILGAPMDAQLWYILDDALPAQQALDLTGSSFDLSGEYPYITPGELGEGESYAVKGIQVFGETTGLADILEIDPATGTLLREAVLSSQLPRAGLSGGIHLGDVDVWTIDARSGKPLPGVGLSLASGGTVNSVRTDPAGHASFTGLPAGAEYTITAGARTVQAFSFARVSAATVVMPLKQAEMPGNTLTLGPCEAPVASWADTAIPLYLTNREHTFAYQISLSFDASQIQMLENDPITFSPPFENPWFQKFSFNNTDGWANLGVILDMMQEEENVIPPGDGLQLLDLNVSANGQHESVVIFENDVERDQGGGTPAPTYSSLTFSGGRSMRPVCQRGLIMATGTIPEVEKGPQDGGHLFDLLEVDVQVFGGDADAFVTGFNDTDPITTPYQPMLMDAVALSGTQEPPALSHAGAGFLSLPEPAGGAGKTVDVDLVELEEGQAFAATFAGLKPDTLGDPLTAQGELLLLGPAGLLGIDFLPFGASGATTEAIDPEAGPILVTDTVFPTLWNVPMVFLINAAGTADDSESTAFNWIDIHDPNCQDECAPEFSPDYDFPAPPTLQMPADSISVTMTTDRHGTYQWTEMPDATYYSLTLADELGAELWSIIMPAGQGGALTLPALPASVELTNGVPYIWWISAGHSSAPFTDNAGDYLDVILGLTGEARSASRTVRFRNASPPPAR